MGDWIDNPAYLTDTELYENTAMADIDPASVSVDGDFWSNLGNKISSADWGKLLPTLATTGLGIYGATAASGAVSDAAKRSADIQQATSLAQIAEMQRQYNQTRDDFAPYRAVGTQALGRLQQRNAPRGNYIPKPETFGAAAPTPQMAGLSEQTATQLMSQPNLTNDQVLMASLKGRLGLR